MKKTYYKLFIFNILILFQFFCSDFALAQDKINALIVRIIDGDTFVIADSSGKELHIRLMNIDAPEKKQSFGTEAIKYCEENYLNHEISAYLVEKDKYKRWMAFLYLNNQCINFELVRQGYAWVYYTVKDKYLLRLQESAQQKRIGLWKDNNPINPHDFRHKKK